MSKALSSAQGIGNNPDFLNNAEVVPLQTRVGVDILQDIIQAFAKLVYLAGVTPNGNFDNEANGYQLLQALETVVRGYAATTTSRGTVEKATPAEAQNATAEKYIDAETLHQVTSATDRLGLVEKATPAEVLAATADKFIDASLLAGAIGGVQIQSVAIGTWDMDTVSQKFVSLAIPSGHKVVGMFATIRDDDAPVYVSFTIGDNRISSYEPDGGVYLFRASGGFFDGPVYGGTVINRGYLTVMTKQI